MIIHNDKHKIQDQRRFNNPTTYVIDSVLLFVLEGIIFRCFILEPFQTSHWYIFGVRSGPEFQSGNLLEDDSTCEKVMQESGGFQMPAVLRQIFVDIYCVCLPTNALLLFEHNLFPLTKDYIRSWNREESFTEVYSRRYEDERSNFRRVQSAVARFSVKENRDSEITMVEKILMGETMVAQFNTGQRKVFDQVMAPINQPTNLLRQFF